MHQHPSRMARLLVIRHGETEWNAARRLQGQTDIPLSPVGRDQADALALQLVDELAPFLPRRPLLYTSDLKRARETAAPAAQRLGVVARPRVDLRERGFGRAEGKTWEELAVELPAEVEAYKSHADRDAIPGMEPLAAFRARILGAVLEIAELAAVDQAPAVVVTHGGALHQLLELAHGDGKRFLVANAALYRFEVVAGKLSPAS